MPIKFSPNEFLDISRDPADLPQESDGKEAVSGAMTRCTNLILDRGGIAITRPGNSKVSSTAIATVAHKLIEQNGNRYAFASTIAYKDEASIVTGLADAAVSAIKYNPYNTSTDTIFFMNGTDRKKIEDATSYEWGIAAPTSAYEDDMGYVYTFDWEYSESHTPTAAGKLTQTYSGREMIFNWEKYLADVKDETIPDDGFASRTCFWHEGERSDLAAQIGVIGWVGVKVTYARYSGSTLIAESNPSEVTIFKATTQPVITWELSSDSQVTHARVYRTVSGGATYYLHDSYAIALQQAALYYEDTDLGATLETDHDRPPAGTIIAGPSFNGQVFVAYNNLLYFSKSKQAEYFPADYYVEVTNKQNPIKAMTFHSGQLYLASDSDIYQIQGTGADTYVPIPMDAITGTINADCFESVKGRGIVHLGQDGLYLFDGVTDVNMTDERFYPIFHDEEVGGIPYLNKSSIDTCWIKKFGDRVYFGYPGGSDTYPKDVLVIDFSSRRIVHYQYAQYLVAVGVDVTNSRLLAIDSNGYTRILEDESATDDDGTDISWEIRSKVFDNLRAFFPRYARYDIDGTATGKIFLEDVLHTSHSITARNKKKRLVPTGNGARIAMGASGSGTVKIYEIEVE